MTLKQQIADARNASGGITTPGPFSSHWAEKFEASVRRLLLLGCIHGKISMKTNLGPGEPRYCDMIASQKSGAKTRGRSSVGRALASQAGCRGFESLRPLSCPVRVYVNQPLNKRTPCGVFPVRRPVRAAQRRALGAGGRVGCVGGSCCIEGVPSSHERAELHLEELLVLSASPLMAATGRRQVAGLTQALSAINQRTAGREFGAPWMVPPAASLRDAA